MGRRSTPPVGSTHQGGNHAVTLADRGGVDEPLVPLAVAQADGINDPILLHIHHHGVDGAFVAAGIHTQGANQIGAGHRSLADQSGANGSADDGGEHRVWCGCLWYCSRWGGTRQGAPQGSGGDAHQEGVVIHTPIGQEGGTWVDQRSIALISDPEVHHPPIGSGADGVDHPTRVGIKTVVDGGDGFEDGHRVRCGLLWNCSR